MRNGTLKPKTQRFALSSRSLRTQFAPDTGPGWIDSDRTMSRESPRKAYDGSEVQPMLQAMLKDRFHLVAILKPKKCRLRFVVSKGGLKIFGQTIPNIP